ncbi:MAG: efflux RND transporter periplasmic adaptor subunit [Epsilonproteobacteria bacterium]|nr:efflux RND transporter periplasmic adaptor subunit [Campylobacterota bacterium]
MKKATFITITLAIAVITLLSTYLYKKHFTHPTALPYTTQKPTRKTLQQTVTAAGVLELKNVMKIGSIQPGFVREILVNENDRVKKDQLLAIIDTGKEDLDYIAAQHRVKKAAAEYDYQQNFFSRQEALHRAGQLAQDRFEQISKDREKALQDLLTEQALEAKAKMEFDSTRIKAPDDGIVIAINATKGMIANDISNITLFEIAPDTFAMKAVIDIDESDIGLIRQGQRISCTVNSFPDKKIKSIIKQISITPHTQGKNAEQQINYKAEADLQNNDLLLRPGMIVNTTININKVSNTLALNGLALQITLDQIKAIAKILDKTHTPLSKDQRRQYKQAHAGQHIKSVWILANDNFTQRAVTLGITDGLHWQVLHGLSEYDDVIIDIDEKNPMENFYQKMFGSGLS